MMKLIGNHRYEHVFRISGAQAKPNIEAHRFTDIFALDIRFDYQIGGFGILDSSGGFED